MVSQTRQFLLQQALPFEILSKPTSSTRTTTAVLFPTSCEKPTSTVAISTHFDTEPCQTTDRALSGMWQGVAT